MESVQDMAARLLHRMVESGEIPIDVVGGREAHELRRRATTGQLRTRMDGQRPTGEWYRFGNPFVPESSLDILADWA